MSDDQQDYGPSAADAPAPDDAAAAAPAEDAANAGSTESPQDAVVVPEPSAAPAPNAEAAAPAPAEPKTKPAISREASFLYRAMRSGKPVDAVVAAVIKGGFELKVGKDARGFCPRSQMDLRPIDDPEALVGRRLAFRVTQVRRGGTDVILSRRALLEATRSEEAKAVRATLVEGRIMQGKVAGLAEFGAFVDLGAGVLGLVHVSELSHGHVRRASDAVHVGDAVQVKILKIDGERGRISLSVRQATEDPWDRWAAVASGTVVRGEVVRLADFGAFVKLEPGVEALAPSGEMPPSVDGWRHGLDPGTTRDWLVLHVDRGARRISLTLPVEGHDPAAPIVVEPGAALQGRVQRVESYGLFVWLGPGRVGLLPVSLAGDLARRLGIGDTVDVEVLELGEGGRKIRLAPRGFGARERTPPAEARRPSRDRDRNHDREREPAERRPPRRPPPAEPVTAAPTGTFGTSLGDKLRAALDRSER